MPGEAYQFDLSVNMDKVDKEFKGLESKYDDLIDKQKELNREAKGFKMGGRGGGGSSGGAGGGRQGIVDPWDDYRNAFAEYDAAKRSGTSGSLMDSYELAAERAAKRMRSAQSTLDGPQGTSIGQKLKDVLMTSRFGVGADGISLMPLIGRMLDVLGPGGGFAAAGIGGAVYLGKEAHELRQTIGNSQFLTGGSPREVGQLGAIGRFTGQSMEQMSGQAMSLAGNLRNGSFGASYAMAHGIMDFGNLYTPNKATNVVKTMQMLRDVPDDAMAESIAHDLNAENLLWVRDLSESDFKDVLSNQSSDMSKGERQKEAHFKKQLGEAKGTIDKAKRTAGGYLLDNGAEYIANIATAGMVSPMMMGMDAAIWILTKLNDTDKAIRNSIAGDPDYQKREKEMAMKAKQPKIPPSTVKAATKNPWTGGFRYQDGTVGGGPQTDGSFPAGWKGQTLNNALDAQAQRLGAYNV